MKEAEYLFTEVFPKNKSIKKKSKQKKGEKIFLQITKYTTFAPTYSNEYLCTPHLFWKLCIISHPIHNYVLFHYVNLPAPPKNMHCSLWW